MTKISEKIVFFGSGPVAAESLRLLAESFDIEAVVTKPRPAHHKGSVPVLEVADTLDLPIHTVVDKTALDELIGTNPFTSRLAILIDFGIIVSRDAINYFPLGIINSHFSLLPQWRGADPITFSILSGQEQTGVSLMLLVAAMDEGPLLSQGVYELPESITTPELTSYLIKLSEALLKDAVPKYITGEIKPRSQEEVAVMMGLPTEPSYSRKLTKEDGIIDWSKPAIQLEREVRAYAEWPKSRTQLGGVDVIITQSHTDSSDDKPGKLEIIGSTIKVYCATGGLCIDRLKPAGRQEMTAQAFLAGYGKRLI